MSALSLHPSRLALPGGTRTLRLELKRNAVPLLLPLLAAVFYFNTLRTADAVLRRPWSAAASRRPGLLSRWPALRSRTRSAAG